MKPLYLETTLIAYKKTDFELYKQELRTWDNIRGFRIENEKEKETIRNIYFDTYDYKLYKAGRIFCCLSNIENKNYEIIGQIGRNNDFSTINGIISNVENVEEYLKARTRNEPMGKGWFMTEQIIKPALETRARYHLINYKKEDKAVKVRFGKIHYKSKGLEREENIITIKTNTMEKEFLDWMLKYFFRYGSRFSQNNKGEYTIGMSKFIR